MNNDKVRAAAVDSVVRAVWRESGSPSWHTRGVPEYERNLVRAGIALAEADAKVEPVADSPASAGDEVDDAMVEDLEARLADCIRGTDKAVAVADALIAQGGVWPQRALTNAEGEMLLQDAVEAHFDAAAELVAMTKERDAALTRAEAKVEPVAWEYTTQKDAHDKVCVSGFRWIGFEDSWTERALVYAHPPAKVEPVAGVQPISDWDNCPLCNGNPCRCGAPSSPASTTDVEKMLDRLRDSVKGCPIPVTTIQVALVRDAAALIERLTAERDAMAKERDDAKKLGTAFDAAIAGFVDGARELTDLLDAMTAERNDALERESKVVEYAAKIQAERNAALAQIAEANTAFDVVLARVETNAKDAHMGRWVNNNLRRLVALHRGDTTASKDAFYDSVSQQLKQLDAILGKGAK